MCYNRLYLLCTLHIPLISTIYAHRVAWLMHIYAVFRGDSMPVQLLGNFFGPETVWVKTKGHSTIHRNSHLILIHTSLWYKYNYFATPNILITVVPPEHWPCRCVDRVDRADCADHAWPCMAMKTCTRMHARATAFSVYPFHWRWQNSWARHDGQRIDYKGLRYLQDHV